MTKLLEVKNLTTCFYRDGKAVPVVDDVSFSIDTNSVLGVVGESGCGKTMTALSITRLLPQRGCAIVSGRAEFNSENITALPESELRKKRGREIAYIFQEPSTALNPVLTVGEQLAEVVEAHREDVGKPDLTQFVISQLRGVGIQSPEKKVRHIRMSYPVVRNNG
jgi:ABC-type dipeptide/oligopeptide/nickel transport system, ATPase component